MAKSKASMAEENLNKEMKLRKIQDALDEEARKRELQIKEIRAQEKEQSASARQLYETAVELQREALDELRQEHGTQMKRLEDLLLQKMAPPPPNLPPATPGDGKSLLPPRIIKVRISSWIHCDHSVSGQRPRKSVSYRSVEKRFLLDKGWN